MTGLIVTAAITCLILLWIRIKRAHEAFKDVQKAGHEFRNNTGRLDVLRDYEKKYTNEISIVLMLLFLVCITLAELFR